MKPALPLRRRRTVGVAAAQPFCNACPTDLADRFEAALTLIPDSSHLVL